MARIVLIFILLSAFAQAKEWRLHIEGMHCIACTLAVKKSLLGVAGVMSAKVNYAKESAIVQASEGVTLQAMQEAVAKTGYTARVNGDK